MSGPVLGRATIGVIGSGLDEHEELARPVGALLAELGLNLLTGGGGGVMTSVSRAFTEAPRRSGICIGVIPCRSEEDRVTPKRVTRIRSWSSRSSLICLTAGRWERTICRGTTSTSLPAQRSSPFPAGMAHAQKSSLRCVIGGPWPSTAATERRWRTITETCRG